MGEAMKESSKTILKFLGVVAVIGLLILFPLIFPKPFTQHIMILLLMYVVLPSAISIILRVMELSVHGRICDTVGWSLFPCVYQTGSGHWVAAE